MKKILILKNDRAGDLISSIRLIYKLIEKNNDISIYLSNTNYDFKFLINKLKIKKINFNLNFLDKIKIFFDLLINKYDEVFIMNNDSYYCSELIYDAFKEDTVFQLYPMTFLHPNTNDTLKVWKDYYLKLGEKIPQNQLGINPGIISLSEKIKIKHIYGYPEGMIK